MIFDGFLRTVFMDLKAKVTKNSRIFGPFYGNFIEVNIVGADFYPVYFQIMYSIYLKRTINRKI